MRLHPRAAAGLGAAAVLSLALLSGCTAAGSGTSTSAASGSQSAGGASAGGPSASGPSAGGPSAGAATPVSKTHQPVKGLTWPGGKPVEAREIRLDKDAVGQSPVSQTVRFDTAEAAPKSLSLGPWALTKDGMVGVLQPKRNYNKLTETTQRQFQLVSVGKTTAAPLATSRGILPQDGPRQLLGLDINEDYVVWMEAPGNNILETTWRLFSKDLKTGKVRLLARAEDFGGSTDKPFEGVTGASAPVMVGDSVVWSSPIVEGGSASATPAIGLLKVKLSGGKPQRIGSNVGRSFAGPHGLISERQTAKKEPGGLTLMKTTGVVSGDLDGKSTAVLEIDPTLDAFVVAAQGTTLMLSVKGSLVIVDTQSKQAFTVPVPAKTKLGQGPAICGQLVTWSVDDRAKQRPQYFFDLKKATLSGFTFPGKTKNVGEAYCNQDVFAATVREPGDPDSRRRVQAFEWESGQPVTRLGRGGA
ncbi:hypothetical protein [Galactobacter caseinivorans]|uniref:hypothetical protein n=1 Tax=Galactobacter caseinivorans TaxID=2676123 RepID=UPI0013143565|nr:hypothetical protein [Galactobacter caseinivorans]